MLSTMRCSECERELTRTTEPSGTIIHAKIAMDVVDYCDKCNQFHTRNKEFYFCCVNCLIEFTRYKLSRHATLLREGK